MNDTILPLPNGDFTTVEHIEKHGPLTVVCHKIRMGDVEDPDLFVAEPIWQWQQTEMGKWVMENAVQEPLWQRMADPVMWGHKYIITAEFEGKKLTEYYLRFGSSKKP